MKINKVIKCLILSDLIFWSGWGLISPVLAIFITQKIQEGSVLVVGIASGIYWLLRAGLRVPIGIFLDGRAGEKDDYFFLTFGLFTASLTPFLFLFAKVPWHVYLIQGIHAVGMAMSLSGWSAIFTRHIDKKREATEWGLDATAVGLGLGISSVIGGWAVTRFGFELVFIVVGILELIGSSLLLLLRGEIEGVFDHGLHFSFKEIFQKEEKS